MALVVRLARRQASTFVTSAATRTSSTSRTAAHLASQLPSTPALTRRFSARASLLGTLLEPRASTTTMDAAELKRVLLAPSSSFAQAQSALDALQQQRESLHEKHFLALIHKAASEGRANDVTRAFAAFADAEARGAVLLPPRADRTWDYASFERLQMYRCVLWSMLSTRRTYRQMNTFFRQHVHGRPNKVGLFESDPLNFLLRAECTGRFADEDDTAWKRRVDAILRKMQLWRFNASYSSSHALFRFMLYHPEVFVSQERLVDGDGGERASKSTNANHSDLALGDVFVRYFNRYPKALRRDSKRISIAVSAAAAAGQHAAAKTILCDAEQHLIRVDAVSFAHAVECAESEEKRMEIVDLFVAAKERNAVYTTQNEPASISNYLLLYAIFDGNFRHMMELLHEMQLYNNAASNRTVEELFESVAQLRAQIRHDAESASSEEGGSRVPTTTLKECPSIEELINDFPNVIPRNVHTISQGILQSLRGGDLLIAFRLLRATVRTTDIVLRRELYAQLMYPLLARGSAQYDELELVEIERYYDMQHPDERVYLNAQVLNLCESNEDFVAMLACLDRWQQQRHAPLSRRSLQRVFDIVSRHLQQLRQEDASKVSYLVEGVELSYRAVLQRYLGIVPHDAAWPFGYAIIRSATNGLHSDLALLLQQAHSQGLVLENAAYKVALEVLDEMGKYGEIRDCVRVLAEHGAYAALVNKYPDLRFIVERSTAAVHLTESS